MKLYGFPPTRALPVVWTLQELGIEYEYVTVGPNEQHRPEFLALNPAAKLPVLVQELVAESEPGGSARIDSRAFACERVLRP